MIEENDCLEVLPRCEKQPREGRSYCIEEKEPEINWQAMQRLANTENRFFQAFCAVVD